MHFLIQDNFTYDFLSVNKALGGFNHVACAKVELHIMDELLLNQCKFTFVLHAREEMAHKDKLSDTSRHLLPFV